jgi:hypothetical protein
MPRLGHLRPVNGNHMSAATHRADVGRVPYTPHAGEAERDAEVAARVAAAREVAEARSRCQTCRYRLWHCCCPGGPRGPEAAQP